MKIGCNPPFFCNLIFCKSDLTKPFFLFQIFLVCVSIAWNQTTSIFGLDMTLCWWLWQIWWVKIQCAYSLIIQFFYLFRTDFNSFSSTYFSSAFVYQYNNLFPLSWAIEWGVDHNSIIAMHGVTSHYLKAVFF